MLIAVVFNPWTTAQRKTPEVDGGVLDLQARVATLEKTVAELRQQIEDDKLVSSLSGKWMEESWIRAGEPIDESEIVFGGGGGGAGGPVAWLLATNASSRRIVLSPEPDTTFYGEFTVDVSKTPAFIDFQMKRNGRSYPVRGIVKHTYMRAEIAIPSQLFDGDTFLDPPRPTTFTSTKENGHSVYRLIRESFKKTGVW